MYKNNRNNKRPGSGAYSADRPRTMHKATCSKCGVGCEVPFKPRDARSVLCDGCFKRGAGPNKKSPVDARYDDVVDRFDRFDKFDKGAKSRPARKEAFSSYSPSERSGGGDANQEIKRQLALINTKLDKIIAAFEEAAFDEYEEE